MTSVSVRAALYSKPAVEMDGKGNQKMKCRARRGEMMTARGILKHFPKPWGVFSEDKNAVALTSAGVQGLGCILMMNECVDLDAFSKATSDKKPAVLREGAHKFIEKFGEQPDSIPGMPQSGLVLMMATFAATIEEIAGAK